MECPLRLGHFRRVGVVGVGRRPGEQRDGGEQRDQHTDDDSADAALRRQRGFEHSHCNALGLDPPMQRERSEASRATAKAIRSAREGVVPLFGVV